MFEFFSHLRYSHPDLFLIIKHWPLTILLPVVLLLIATLSFITRVWDDREREKAEKAPRPVSGN